MEHLSSIVPRALALGAPTNGAAAPASHAAPPPRARAETLYELVHDFEEDEARENPDVVVPLASLRLTGDGHVEVPRLGTFAFTDWSRRQCAALLGVRWDRWFENATALERAEELGRRFSRATASVRVRTTRDPSSAADGTLRAFVSPGYTPVVDSALGRMLLTVLEPVDSELRLVRFDVTDRSVSYVIKVGEAYRPGGAGEVGDLWGGVLVRNSGVGFASLLVTLHLTRLVCKNGMTAPLPDAVLLRRRHRGIGGEDLRVLLAERVARLPERLARGADVLRAARERPVGDVDAALLDVLERADIPRRHLPAVRAAYDEAPEATAFGVSQALTLAAQRMSAELRFDLEQAAGAYLASA